MIGWMMSGRICFCCCTSLCGQKAGRGSRNSSGCASDSESEPMPLCLCAQELHKKAAKDLTYSYIFVHLALLLFHIVVSYRPGAEKKAVGPGSLQPVVFSSAPLIIMMRLQIAAHLRSPITRFTGCDPFLCFFKLCSLNQTDVHRSQSVCCSNHCPQRTHRLSVLDPSSL